MTFQIIINVIIAIMWMFLQETYTVATFIGGYIVGLVLLLLLDRFVPDSFYLKRFFKTIQLILLFIKELISANWDIIKLVYKPKLDIEPGIFAYPTELKSNLEITLLANLITLTPGTLTVAVSDESTHLYIHAMDIEDIDKSIAEIKNTFEKAIMEVTR